MKRFTRRAAFDLWTNWIRRTSNDLIRGYLKDPTDFRSVDYEGLERGISEVVYEDLPAFMESIGDVEFNPKDLVNAARQANSVNEMVAVLTQEALTEVVRTKLERMQKPLGSTRLQRRRGHFHPRVAQEPEATDPKLVEQAADAIVDLSNSILETLPHHKKLDEPLKLATEVVKALQATKHEDLAALAAEVNELFNILEDEKKDLAEWYTEFFSVVKNHPGFPLLGLREKA
jgi:hypothetical protein